MLNPYLDIHPDIERAIAEGKPVVALESTIISHGMPYPQNVETALRVEQKVRDSGAIPATIAILKGRLKVGLSEEEIGYLGQQGQKAKKTSRRDIPFIVATKGDGATTVASTMILADMAGIRVFATGGIGGVHRGAENSLDISADLEELAQTKVAVVCAGIKSILDLGLTLEYLETKGVPVVGYQTNTLPAFYSRESAFNVDYRLDTPLQIADALKAKWAMSLAGGAIIANPIPTEHAMANEDIDHVIQSAIEEMDSQGIKGKASTPFLLAKVAQKTQGESLKANIALVLNNAELASKIAFAYCS